MVDNNVNYFPTPILEGFDSVKYAPNPFATVEPQNQQETLKSGVSENITLFCSHCDLTFINSVDYEHHNVELHGKKKLLSCDICQATFRRPDHLKRHIQSLHNNQKYCVCPVCEKDCKRQDILLKHIKKKHSTTAEVFRCRECEFQCGTLADLEKHELTHLFTDRHLCPHCQLSFKRRDHMLRHVKSQHSNQIVVCPICGQTYKRKYHLVRHVREKHKMELLNGKLVTSSGIVGSNKCLFDNESKC